MADDDCVKLLTKWGLQHLIEICKAHKITSAALECLDVNAIDRLVPKIGPQAIFKRKWKEHFEKTHDKENVETGNVDLSETSTQSSTTESDLSEDDSKNTGPQPLTRQKCFVGKAMYKRLCRPNVLDILKASDEGRKILKNYAKTKSLSRIARNSVADIIITYILNTVKGPIDKNDFKNLATGIVKIFPTEDINVYYVAPIRKNVSKSNKSVSRNKRAKSKKLIDPEDETPPSKTSLCDVDCQNSIEWLKSKNEKTWDLILTHWQATARFRRDQIRDNKDITINKSSKIGLYCTI